MKLHALTLALPLAALTALTACDNSAPESQATDADASDLATSPQSAQDMSDQVPDTEETSSTASPLPTSAGSGIPAVAQGRWGLVAADCDPNRDDAKGLMVIDGDKLEFYESMGTLSKVQDRSSSRIRATFAFTGEGMSWQREMVLDVQDRGQVLISRQYGEDAMPGPMRYMKCG